MRSIQPNLLVKTAPFMLPSGETVIDFNSSTPPVPSGTPGDDRLLSFKVKDLQIDLSTQPSGH
jgi:hypothetical protein